MKRKTNKDSIMKKIEEFLKPLDSGISIINKRPDGLNVFFDPINSTYSLYYIYERYGQIETDEILTEAKREDVVKYLYNLDSGKIKLQQSNPERDKKIINKVTKVMKNLESSVDRITRNIEGIKVEKHGEHYFFHNREDGYIFEAGLLLKDAMKKLYNYLSGIHRQRILKQSDIREPESSDDE